MGDFNWNDSDNMDWGSFGQRRGNYGQNMNRYGNFDANYNRGRGRVRGGGANNFNKTTYFSNKNSNYAPIDNNQNSDNSFDLKNQDDVQTTNFEEMDQKNNLSNSNEDAPSTSEEQEKEDSNSFGANEVSDWTDMKQFDDDHDNEWFIAEENKMAEKYGGKFIKVRYTTQGRVGYLCELCLSECNAKKSLELHCGGMKHLKKKDLWEKQKRKPLEVEENPIGLVPPSQNAPKSKKHKKEWSSKIMAPMKPLSLYNDHNLDSDPLLEPPYMRNSRSPIDRLEQNPVNWYGKDRYLETPQYFPRRGRSPSPNYGRMLPNSPERRRTNSFTRRSPPSYGHYGHDTRSGGWGSEQSDMGGRYGYPSREKSPVVRYGVPSPPRIPKRSRSPSPSKKLNLSGSPAGALLQKLAECCVKTEGDADLALSVVGALTKSMKEYAYKNNEVKIAELLMEAELKIGTVKALKAGMKMLSTVSSNAIISKPPQLVATANPNENFEPPRNSDMPNTLNKSSTHHMYGTY